MRFRMIIWLPRCYLYCIYGNLWLKYNKNVQSEREFSLVSMLFASGSQALRKGQNSASFWFSPTLNTAKAERKPCVLSVKENNYWYWLAYNVSWLYSIVLFTLSQNSLAVKVTDHRYKHLAEEKFVLIITMIILFFFCHMGFEYTKWKCKKKSFDATKHAFTKWK